MMGRLDERFSRMNPAARGVALAVTFTFALFVLGFWVGFFAASIEHGHLLPRSLSGWLAVAIGAVATIVSVQLLRAQLRTGLFTGMTPFDRRYWKMMMWIGLLGVPIGIGLMVLGLIDMPGRDLEGLFGSGPIGPLGAAIAAAVFVALLGIAMWLYHRAIDDHEERAYLWGSQIAYYFVSLAIPAWWLLSRGGIVPPLDFTAAFSIVIISFVVQAAVWAWFKFR
ncbi:MAG: hypothetical protein M3Q83_02845 [Pseudomonadota bacterium]|nr:hypothetical protein [Pseudomonadota bacterium]